MLADPTSEIARAEVFPASNGLRAAARRNEQPMESTTKGQRETPRGERNFAVIAHRGASYDSPENTLSAARLAWEQDADAVEVDVRLTRDGKLVAMHDACTLRTTGVAGIVADTTFRRIRELDAGRWKGEGFKEERVPLLEEIVGAAPDYKRLFIEIKCGHAAIPELRVTLKRVRRQAERFVIICFNYWVLRTIKSELPGFDALWLLDGNSHTGSGLQKPDMIHLFRACKAAGLDGLKVHYQWLRDRRTIESVRDEGLKLYAWTVNDPAIANRLVSAGVDGITTDRPGWLRSHLNEFFI